jgi:hypothetical protein
MSESLIVWLSTNAVATWLITHIASRLDPLIFQVTNGRFTSMGPPAMPMLTLTATGCRTGRRGVAGGSTGDSANERLREEDRTKHPRVSLAPS